MPYVIEILAGIPSGLRLPNGVPLLRLRAVMFLILPAVLLGVTVIVGPAWATDHGQLGPISPDIKQWAGTLENKLKIGCCATADGWKPEAVEYDMAADHYRVRIDGEWYDVPADAVLDGPNKFGFAVVWYYRTYLNSEKSLINIRCFLPGAGG